MLVDGTCKGMYISRVTSGISFPRYSLHVPSTQMLPGHKFLIVSKYAQSLNEAMQGIRPKPTSGLSVL